MRKLTVKNFSVIKEAELEFGKITVLIGPQASGKSLLCKLAHFLGREVIEIATARVARLYDYSEFETFAKSEFERWFPRGGWGTGDWSIHFSAGGYEAMIAEPLASGSDSAASITFADAFKEEYNRRLEVAVQEQQSKGFVPPLDVLRSLAATRFTALAERGIWDGAIYIPSERSYFVDTQRGYRTLGAEAEPISAYFAVVYADSMNREIPKPRIPRFLKGDLVYMPDGPSIAFYDERLLPLSNLSSGSKEILPILSVLDMYERRRRQSGWNLPKEELYGDRLYFFDDFTIEEPEAGVFPQTQYELIKEFAALSNETEFHPYFTITTHSPYILTSFNNLIEAGQAARNNPKLHDEVAKIVPEQYWIKEGDFKAYAIEDGVLKPILNESGFVEANYLDQVSEVIGDEFDKLLRLEYENTKAS